MGKKLTKEGFIDKAMKVHGNKYDYYLVEYKNNSTPIEVKCSDHGIFKPTPKNHLNGSICPKCANNYMDKEFFIEKARKLHGNEYSYSLVDYKKTDVKVKIICSIHGEFGQTPNSHLSGCGCKQCDLESRLGKSKLNAEEFIKRAKLKHGDKYGYSLVEYKNYETKVKIICPIHGVFEQKPYLHSYGSGCQVCKESKGEKLIRKYLLDNNINFVSQKTFDNCINERKLPFDFYLPSKNICIEYDGRQHFESVNIFGGKIGFERCKINDKIKDKYCQDKGIHLIRIPYFKDDIKTILKEVING